MIYHEKYNGKVICKSSGKQIAEIDAEHPAWSKYLEAKAEGQLGEPIPAPTPHVRTVEEARAEKIAAAKAKTAELFAAGIKATVDGVEHTFDVGGGERSLSSWLGFGALTTDTIAGIVPTAYMPKASTKDGQRLTLTPAAGKMLFLSLMAGYQAITGPEDEITKAAEASADIAFIDALKDPR